MKTFTIFLSELKEFDVFIHCVLERVPLNVITLFQIITDYNNQMITLFNFCLLFNDIKRNLQKQPSNLITVSLL